MSDSKTKSAVNHALVTAHDTNLIGPCRALRILTAGNLKVALTGDPTVFETYPVVVGEVFPCTVAVMHTGSTCTAIRWW